MADFIIEVLSRDQIRSVYPLVREAFPTLDLSDLAALRAAAHRAAPRRAVRDRCGASRRQGIPLRAVLLPRGG